jgi:hypothetical protein
VGAGRLPRHGLASIATKQSDLGRGDLAQAGAGELVVLTLADEIDVSRGDIISAADASAEVADQFEGIIVGLGEQPMLRGRGYLLRIGTKTVGATIARRCIDFWAWAPRCRRAIFPKTNGPKHLTRVSALPITTSMSRR